MPEWQSSHEAQGNLLRHAGARGCRLVLRAALEIKLKSDHQKASGEQGRHSKISGIHWFDTGVLEKRCPRKPEEPA